jgi:sensor histidine kinase YesM
MNDPVSLPSATLARRVWASLNAGRLGVTLGVAVAVAVLLSPAFAIPFTTLLGRAVFVAMMLLLAFVLAQQMPDRLLPRWLPRWLFTVLAVALMAPLASFMAYVVAVGGQIDDLFTNIRFISGMAIFSAVSLLLGLLITLTAQVREREARNQALQLQFELDRSRLEKQALDARLSLLQAQIEPHFLFNTLANVQALVESGSPRAAPVLQSLIQYLRAAMPRLQGEAPALGNELALVRAYLELMQMRMPDRLRFEISVPPALHTERFPPMALLTLVENAVRHGIDPSEHGGQVQVGGQHQGNELQLWVADNGVGMAETSQPGTGLANVRERIAGFFGPGAALRLVDVAPHGLRAEIVWTR